MTAQPFHGVLVPVLTPFTASGEPDAARFTAFCRWLLDQGAGGLAIFGTTSEANSMSPGERMALLDYLVAAGIPAEKLIVSSDCGFGRQGCNRDIAFYKASSIAQGCNIVRRELGVPTTNVPATDPKLQIDVVPGRTAAAG